MGGRQRLRGRVEGVLNRVFNKVHHEWDTRTHSTQGGVKHGSGTYTWPNGAVYTGDWLNGCMHGVGTFNTVDGSCYTGSWAEDLKQGLGRKAYPNGDVYEVCPSVSLRRDSSLVALTDVDCRCRACGRKASRTVPVAMCGRLGPSMTASGLMVPCMARGRSRYGNCQGIVEETVE